MKFTVAIALCLVSVVSAHPSGGRSGGGKSGEARDGDRPDLSFWNRTIDGNTVFESGFSNATTSVVIIRSGARHEGGETLYDFSGASVVVLVKAKPGGCVVIPTDASVTTFDAAAAEVNNRNGTTIGAPAGSVQLNATAGTNSTASSDAITRFCHGLEPIEAVAAGADFPAPGSEPEGQKVLSFNSLDTSVKLLVARPPPREGKPEGKSEGKSQGKPEGAGGKTGGKSQGAQGKSGVTTQPRPEGKPEGKGKPRG